MGKVSTRILAGAALGAGFFGGFATGIFIATPAARSAGQSVLGGLGTSVRYAGRGAVRAVDGLGSFLESGYTRIRGREAYLEREIETLRDQITRLEQRVPQDPAQRDTTRQPPAG
ncbi:MAG: hypothetical protein H0V53_01170 [Rubrobacter sp.]|nr:hypothetical protein [Rubrobacter sp.]